MYELVVAGGTVVTASDVFRADVGIAGGRIAAIGLDLKGERTLDASGLLVLPGGVDSHCHIEQLREAGISDARIVLEPIGRNSAPAIAACSSRSTGTFTARRFNKWFTSASQCTSRNRSAPTRVSPFS